MILVHGNEVKLDYKDMEGLCLDVMMLNEALSKVMPEDLLRAAMTEAINRKGMDIVKSGTEEVISREWQS